MSKHIKYNRRKRRRENRDKFKKRPADIQDVKINDADVDYDRLEEDIVDLLRAPGAVVVFFDEK